MKLIKKRLLTVVLTGFLLFNVATATHGFSWMHVKNVNTTLMHKIDKPQWVIGYRFADDCPAEFRAKAAELEKLITDILREWQEPLREMHPERQITDDFRFSLGEDFDGMGVNRFGGFRGDILNLDMIILFYGEAGRGISSALVPFLHPPIVSMGEGTVINARFTQVLVHESGHVFGLGDTYVRVRLLQLPPTTGGLAGTMGKQPASMMSGLPSRGKFGIGEDDRRGIVWLYKYLYEGQLWDDCFFFDYVFEEFSYVWRGIRWWEHGCRPKHPLIFEVKHGVPRNTTQILRDDPTLDLNERDAGGFTALHHAVMSGGDGTNVVTELLKQDGIKVNILSKDTRNRTPAQLAREFGLLNIAKLIEAHPIAKLRPWSVALGGKLTTTWGHLKQHD